MDDDATQQLLHENQRKLYQEANMKTLAQALVKAQATFGRALKSSDNPYFKSKYADLGSVVDAVMEPLNDHGIAVIQRTEPSETGVIVETLFVHESGEQMSAGRLYLPAPQQDPQKYGGALTYARRYALMSACGIAPEDDDGNAAAKALKDEQSKPITAEQAGEIRALVDEVGADEARFCSYFKIESIDELPAGKYRNAVAGLEKKRKEAA